MNAPSTAARPFGPWTAMARGIGNMIGVGIFVLPRHSRRMA
jgi:hypothetical protein